MRVVVKIAKADLPVFADGGVNGVHRVVDALALGLGARRVDLALQRRRAVAAGLAVLDGDGAGHMGAVQLADQLAALFLGQKIGGADDVHQHFQLGELIGTRNHSVAALRLKLHHHAVLIQRADVVVERLALGAHAHLGKPCLNFGERHRVLGVGLPQKQLHEAEQLALLIFRACHFRRFRGRAASSA